MIGLFKLLQRAIPLMVALILVVLWVRPHAEDAKQELKVGDQTIEVEGDPTGEIQKSCDLLTMTKVGAEEVEKILKRANEAAAERGENVTIVNKPGDDDINVGQRLSSTVTVDLDDYKLLNASDADDLAAFSLCFVILHELVHVTGKIDPDKEIDKKYMEIEELLEDLNRFPPESSRAKFDISRIEELLRDIQKLSESPGETVTEINKVRRKLGFHLRNKYFPDGTKIPFNGTDSEGNPNSWVDFNDVISAGRTESATQPTPTEAKGDPLKDTPSIPPSGKVDRLLDCGGKLDNTKAKRQQDCGPGQDGKRFDATLEEFSGDLIHNSNDAQMALQTGDGSAVNQFRTTARAAQFGGPQLVLETELWEPILLPSGALIAMPTTLYQFNLDVDDSADTGLVTPYFPQDLGSDVEILVVVRTNPTEFIPVVRIWSNRRQDYIEFEHMAQFQFGDNGGHLVITVPLLQLNASLRSISGLTLEGAPTNWIALNWQVRNNEFIADFYPNNRFGFVEEE